MTGETEASEKVSGLSQLRLSSLEFSLCPELSLTFALAKACCGDLGLSLLSPIPQSAQHCSAWANCHLFCPSQPYPSTFGTLSPQEHGSKHWAMVRRVLVAQILLAGPQREGRNAVFSGSKWGYEGIGR